MLENKLKVYEEMVVFCRSMRWGVRVRKHPQEISETAKLTPVFTSNIYNPKTERNDTPVLMLTRDRPTKYTRYQIPQITEKRTAKGYTYSVDRFRFALELKHERLIYCDTSTVSRIYSDGKKATLIYDVDRSWVIEHVGSLKEFLGWCVGKPIDDGKYDPVNSFPPPEGLEDYSPCVSAGLISKPPIFTSSRYLTKSDGLPFKESPVKSLIDMPAPKRANLAAWHGVVAVITSKLLNERVVSLNQRELAKEFDVSNATLSRHVNAMYDAGYLTRLPPFTSNSTQLVTSFKL